MAGRTGDGLRVETGCAHADHSDQLKKRVVLRDMAFLRADDAGSHLDPLGPSASFHFRCVSPRLISLAGRCCSMPPATLSCLRRTGGMPRGGSAILHAREAPPRSSAALPRGSAYGTGNRSAD